MNAAAVSQVAAGRVAVFRHSFGMLLRDWRAGEITVLFVALVIAVGSLTAVAFLTDRVSQVVEQRAAESLAADLRLESTQPISESYADAAQAAGLQTARITSMPTVVIAGSGDSETNTLGAVRAATAGYPLRGRLKIADHLLGEQYSAQGIPAPGTAWASPRLLTRLGVGVGTEVRIGRATFKVVRVLVSRPDEGFRFTDLAPSIIINEADLPATDLIQPGSRVAYRALYSGTRPQVERFKPELESLIHDGERVRDIRDANPQIRSAMERSGRFLNLASLVSVLLASVAVAMSARRYARRHRDRVALMKCLGSSRRQILTSSLLQLLQLALASGIVGILVGYFGHSALAWIMRDLIQYSLPAPSWSPVGLGLVTSLMVLAGFALPDLMQSTRTPPLRVLRKDVEPPPIRYGLSWVAAVLAVWLLLFWLIEDPTLVLYVFAGAVLTFAALALAGWLLVALVRHLRSAGGVAWRFGLASLARRGRESIAQVVAFGLGLMVLLLLTTVRNDLLENWKRSLPEDAPNQFLINIQPQEVEPVKRFFDRHGMPVPELSPMVRGRMTQINGVPVGELTFPNPQGSRWAFRDANLSWSQSLQPDNKITAGAYWESGFRGNEISVEADFAADLGVGPGDRLTFDVAGESVSGTISSLRSVEWDSFRPNFFIVFSPGSLEEYPSTWITSIHVREEDRPAMLDLMRAFPSVTAIDLDAALAQVRDVMDKAAIAVRSVFLFTLFAGVIVLWAAVQSTGDERRYESAMLRTLGARRSRVLAGVATEFIAIGLLAGILAAAGATGVSWVFTTRLLELPFTTNPLLWIAGPIFGMMLVGAAGMLAAWRVVTHAPVNVLRSA